MRALAIAILLALSAQQSNRPAAQIVDTPSVKILKGLTAPEFEAEMQQMNVALGVACGFCHARGNFASDDNPHKATARRMLEMTQTINRQFFADYQLGKDESRLGRVTCYTCHQGEQKPKKPEL
jgi:Photosynthetic reaction centre cytochrome C subunit